MPGEENFLTGEDARLKMECFSRCVRRCIIIGLGLHRLRGSKQGG